MTFYKVASGYVNSFLWKTAIDIVDLSIEHGDFSRVMLVYQRVIYPSIDHGDFP